MKKLLALLLALALLIPAACAEGIDLSALSFDQLVELRQQISKELTTRPEWKEVTVPVGVWKVGEDIPAGKWTVKPMAGKHANLELGSAVDSAGLRIDLWKSSFYDAVYIYDPGYPYFDAVTDRTSVDLTLQIGTYVIVSSGAVIFTPFTGRPSLGF